MGAARDVHDAAAEVLKLGDADRAEVLPSGRQRVYKNRAGWAHDRLKRAGFSRSLRRGHWQLTEQGHAFASSHPAPLSIDALEKIATEIADVPIRPAHEPTEPVTASVAESAKASPDDRLEQAITELRQSVTVELLDMLSQVSPEYFETIVLDLCTKWATVPAAPDLLRVGRTGDGGIDGVISLDRLGLEKVYVQAKRWQGPVGRPDVQAFYGALAGQRANKGVSLPPLRSAQQATDFAKSVERIVLVNGGNSPSL